MKKGVAMGIHRPYVGAEFVSICETVKLVADEKEIDIETVAGYIHRRLLDSCSATERPRFFAVDRIGQRLIERDDDFVIDRLREIERTGLFFEAKTGDGYRYCSDFGFVREEISKFLGIQDLFAVSGADSSVNGHGIVDANADESAEQRRSRIVRSVNENKAKGIPKTKTFSTLAATETVPCSASNIRRIYRGY